MKYTTCPYCGKSIVNCSIKRHLNSHETGYLSKPAYKHSTLDHDDLFCKYCGVEKHNRNSLIQHEIRCPKNPNKIANQLNGHRSIPKGATKETCETIRKQLETRRKKQEQGIKTKCTHHVVVHMHDEHNNQEIQKWINYVSSIDLHLDDYETYECGPYTIIKYSELTRRCNAVIGSKSTVLHEHVYIMLMLFGDSFSKENVIHHIDENKHNNVLANMILFETRGEHARFHNADDAYLVYNEITHKFNCIRVS